MNAFPRALPAASFGPNACQGILLPAFLLVSLALVPMTARVLAQVPAQGAPELRIEPAYEDEFRREVYVGAGAWRGVPDDQKVWRRNQEEASEGRIEFGYDSSYEALRERGALDDAGTGLRDPRPATVLRLRF